PVHPRYAAQDDVLVGHRRAHVALQPGHARSPGTHWSPPSRARRKATYAARSTAGSSPSHTSGTSATTSSSVVPPSASRQPASTAATLSAYAASTWSLVS